MSEPRDRARHPRGWRLAIAAATGAAGAGLLYFAVPIAAAALAEIPGNEVLARLHAETADAPALRRIVRSREAAVGWRGTGRTWAELGLALIMLDGEGRGSKRNAPLALAEEALTRSLGLAPMNPYAWMRLVLVRMTNGRPAAEIAPPLGLALATGPREDRMDTLMVEAGLLCWNELDDHDRDRIAERVRREWWRDPLRTATLAERAERMSLLARLVGLGQAAVEPAR